MGGRADGSSCPGDSPCPYAWVGADLADPPNPDTSFVSELYNLDVIACK